MIKKQYLYLFNPLNKGEQRVMVPLRVLRLDTLVSAPLLTINRTRGPIIIIMVEGEHNLGTEVEGIIRVPIGTLNITIMVDMVDHPEDGMMVMDNHHYHPRTPLYTHNHFSPLRDEYPQEIHNNYSYMDREEDSYSRSPYNYNQTNPGQLQQRGFPRQTQNHKPSSELNKAPEGGGISRGKRKRT